jgi:hypothetical protein
MKEVIDFYLDLDIVRDVEVESALTNLLFILLSMNCIEKDSLFIEDMQSVRSLKYIF